MDTTYYLERKKYASLLSGDNHSLPHRYVLIVTNKCNLRCSFCFQEKKYIPGSLNLNDWVNVIDQLPPYAWVTLTGGEPLFFKEFKRLFSYVTKKFPCNIISNGLLLDEDLVDFLCSHDNFRALSVSIDDQMNSVRGVKPADWRRTESVLRYLSGNRQKLARNIIFDTKTVVLDSNASDLFDIFRYCTEDLGADTHSFQFLKGSGLQHADLMSPFERVHEVAPAPTYSNWGIIVEQLNKVREYKAERDKRSYVHPKFVDLRSPNKIIESEVRYINSEFHEERRFMPCKALWESVHINTEGEVFPCLAISIGNIKRATLQEIIDSDANQRFRALIKERGSVSTCNRCGYLLPRVDDL
jgi:hypothetical protein